MSDPAVVPPHVEDRVRVRRSGAALRTAGGAALPRVEAVGLEWPEVVLVDPDAILADHGPAGPFIAATRAIVTLYLAG